MRMKNKGMKEITCLLYGCKAEKHICALTSLFLQRDLYTLCMNSKQASKQCIYIYFITDILDGRDNNKIDIVQYKLGVAYIFLFLLSLARSLTRAWISKQTNENMTCIHNMMWTLCTLHDSEIIGKRTTATTTTTINGDNDNNEKKL